MGTIKLFIDVLLYLIIIPIGTIVIMVVITILTGIIINSIINCMLYLN